MENHRRSPGDCSWFFSIMLYLSAGVASIPTDGRSVAVEPYIPPAVAKRIASTVQFAIARDITLPIQWERDGTAMDSAPRDRVRPPTTTRCNPVAVR